MDNIRALRKNDKVTVLIHENSDQDSVPIRGTVMDKDPEGAWVEIETDWGHATVNCDADFEITNHSAD